MKFLKIIILHSEQVFEQRLRSLVWFFVAIINPLVLILFWKGAGTLTKEIAPGWTIARLNSYYLLMMVAGSLLLSHIEEDISFYDIQLGELVRYLLRPFPYYWIKMFEELPYRLLQGTYGMIALIFISVLFGDILDLAKSPLVLVSGVVVAILGFFISHTFKMILGLTAFWLEDIHGFFELLEVIRIVLGGFIIPLAIMPNFIRMISNFTPFAYIAYYPIVAFQGKEGIAGNLRILSSQFFWLAILLIIYKIIWKKGIKKFVGSGQ